jgi:hypothetical protein
VRRVIREIKKYAQSRESWRGQIGSGFMITKLVTERYYGDADREDMALYYTMKAIRDRLNSSLVVNHPVTPGETITKGNDDPKARFLRDRLTDALGWLEVLFDPSCTREQALKAWDRVFATDYFTARLETEAKKSARTEGAPYVLTSGLLNDWERDHPQEPVRKEGGGRYA